MLNKSKMLKLFALVLLALGLTACGDSVEGGTELLACDVPNIPDSSGTSCVPPPPISCPAPTVPDANNESCVVGADPNAPMPTVFPGENEAILFYNRPQDATNSPNDSVYDGYRLHTWNDEAGCNAYQPESQAESWSNGLQRTGIDPNYGAYWILKLKEGYAGTEGACGNFIIHKGTDDAGKELGGGDFKMPLSQDDPDFTRMNWTLSGVASVFEFPILSLGEQPVAITDMAAHWIDQNTLVWDIEAAALKLHHSATAGLAVDDNDTIAGDSIEFLPTDLTDAQKAANPQLADWAAFSANVETATAKQTLKEQLVAGAYNADGELTAATYVQTPGVIDNLYTAGDEDADEATLGLSYDGDEITASLWAPTAQNVKLKVYDAGKTETASHDMTLDPATGIWSYTGSGLDRQFYRYEITVYHPVSKQVETLESTDPYSVSLSTNGRYSQFVNLNDDDLKPQGWDGQMVAEIAHPEDAVIYEGHIRDFSIRDESTSPEHRGKYLAFTEMNSAPVQHLIKLADAGVTHFHMLPASDMATVDENEANQINLTSTVGELCAKVATAPVCGVENDSSTLLSVMENYPSYQSTEAQALVESMRDLDGFNWGYDPQHFNTPEGSYATDPDGVARIVEMREMNMALHEMGLRIALDVVYNHTNASGLNSNSVLDKVVPGYYHRYDTVTGGILRETCCDDTAPENRMMAKFMQDSLLMWTEQYKFDAFRFDIMSHASKDTMLALRDAVQAVDPDNYFYGEGWTRDDHGYEQANQDNLAGTEIGTFNDRPRDIIRSGSLFNEDGSLDDQDHIRLGLAGTLADYVLQNANGVVSAGSSFSHASYAQDPADIINYVSKHDNETLWDQLQYGLPTTMTLAQRTRAQHIAATIPLLSQGIPFLQMGGDLIRSKSMDRDSYNSGDWFNYVDFTMNTNNWNVGLPPADKNMDNWDTINALSNSVNADVGMNEIFMASEMFNEILRIRASSPLFRLTTGQEVIDRVGFHNIGKRQQQGLIVMSIDDGIGLTDLDPMNDAIVVVINGSTEEQSHTVATASGFELHAILQGSMDSTVKSASFTEGEGEGTFTVPALTTAVFVKPQMGMQGEGLSASATQGAPDVVPYGDTAVYIRGDMNGWSTDDVVTYKGQGVYEVAIALTGGTTYGFKFASEDWATVNFGAMSAGDTVVSEDMDHQLAVTNDNLSFTPAIDATYVFAVDASDKTAPVLNIRNEEPYPGETVFIRGDMNGWGEVDALNYDGAGLYSVSLTLDAGTYSFKVASADWSTVNFGAISADDTVVMVGDDEFPLASTNDNLQITIAEAGDYLFTFDASDKSAATLSVFNAVMFGDTPVYLRGDMNGWGTDDEIQFESAGTYSIVKNLSAGTYGFKVASEDWATVNLGAASGEDAPVLVDVAETLVQGSNDNFSIQIDVDGDYKFTVQGPNPAAPVLTVTAVTP